MVETSTSGECDVYKSRHNYSTSIQIFCRAQLCCIQLSIQLDKELQSAAFRQTFFFLNPHHCARIWIYTLLAILPIILPLEILHSNTAELCFYPSSCIE